MSCDEIFRHNLKVLRGGKSQNQIADDIGIKRSTYSMWERKATPPINVLAFICKYHNISMQTMLTVPLTSNSKAND